MDRFAEAAREFMGREPEELPWWVKIEKPGVMDLIRPEEVIGNAGPIHGAALIATSARSFGVRQKPG